MRTLILAAAVLCASTACANDFFFAFDNSGNIYSRSVNRYGGYAFDNYGNMTVFNGPIRPTFPAYQPMYRHYVQPFYYQPTPIVVPGYGYGGYRQARHIGF